MRITRAAVLAGCATASLAAVAAAQPGTRNAIVYAARAVGETDWHVGNFSLQSQDTNPLTFEIGVFFFRAQGHGLSTAVYKTYITFVGWQSYDNDGASIIEDASNGVPPSGVDGRVSVYNSGAQSQAVFVHDDGPPQQGAGFRISAFNDATDAGAAGGISVKQTGPLNNPDFHTANGDLGYRFNVTVAPATGPRTVLIDTPLNRIHSFTTYNADTSNTTTEFKATVVVDAIALTATWIPAPSGLALLVLAVPFTAGRRRPSRARPLEAPKGARR